MSNRALQMTENQQEVTVRPVVEVKRAQASMDGAGVAIKRVAGFGHAGMDPILMVDELRSEHREDFAAGFPPHPHRGMQTLTYMKHGGLIHEDNQGNRGEIRSGGAQYMSAGSGIVHSEMPTQDSQGLHGFQLWINLPAAEKMSAPRYRDLNVDDLTVTEGDGYKVTSVSGEWQVAGDATIQGPLTELAPQAALADVELGSNKTLEIGSDITESVMAYVYDGELRDEKAVHSSQRLLVLGRGDVISLRSGDDGVRLLLLRGAPIGEPVVHYGPFVMNTQAEIETAIRDYQSGAFAA